MICGSQGLRKYKYKDKHKEKYKDKYKNNQQTHDVICFWKGDDKRSLIRYAVKKKTILFGNFSQHGGGAFPNPKTFVNLPSIFLYAKFILRC